MSRLVCGVGICVALIALLLPLPASAGEGAGRLDPTYGRGGLTMTPVGVAGELGAELSTTASGAAVVASGLDGTAVRFAANGAWDTRFGRDGQLVLPRGPAIGGRKMQFQPRSIYADHRGRVLVFGERLDRSRSVEGLQGVPIYASSAMVLRFTPAGRLDKSFGEGKGYVALDFGLPQNPTIGVPTSGTMAGRVDSRNRPLFVADTAALVASCYAHGTNGVFPRALVRLTESGQPDPAFGGGDGVSPLEGLGSFPDLGIDAADQPAVGVDWSVCGARTRVYRFDAEGEPLASFGPGGLREFTPVHLALVEPSGAMILDSLFGRHLKLVEVGPEGEREAAFGQGGALQLRLPVKVGLQMSPAAVDAKGRILLAGFVGSPIAEPEKGQPKRSSFVVARLLPDGKIDHSFGRKGWIFTHLPEPFELNSVQATLDPRGRLLLAGIATKPNYWDGAFVAARYLVGSAWVHPSG
jgi:uncharacterized delta-60 repeat protein